MVIEYLLFSFALAFQVAIAVAGLAFVYIKGKNYGWFITAAFAIWSIYDLVTFGVTGDYLTRSLNFIASLSILWAVRGMYLDK